MRQEFLQGVYSQEVFVLDNQPQSPLSFDEFRSVTAQFVNRSKTTNIFSLHLTYVTSPKLTNHDSARISTCHMLYIKTEYTSDVEKLRLLESIYEDFIQYSHNVYSSPPVNILNMHMDENLEKIPGDKSCNSSRDKNYEVTDFSFCDETMNLSLYSQIGNGLNLADELKVADSNQTLVDGGKCSSLADELQVADSNQTLVDGDKCSSLADELQVADSNQTLVDGDKCSSLADELQVADSNQTLVDGDKCSSLADELQVADSNQTLFDDDKCSSFPFKKEDNESFTKENIHMDSSVLKREVCNDCHHCCEKEKVLIDLNKKIILQNEISDKLQAEVKILQKREKELENELNIKSGKQKDLENELNMIKKKEKDLIGDLLRRETDLKNLELEMKETKEQHSCRILEMETKENELVVQIEELKEKEGDYLNELNELREKEEEVESMIMEFLDKEKLLEEKKNKLDKETNRLKDELLENSTTINDLKSKIVDYETELEILRSQKPDSCKVEEKKGCDCKLVPDSDSNNHMKLELHRLTKDLVEKENLLEETEKELKKNVKELEDKLLEKSDAISNLEFEVNDCKKELEMYKTQKSDGFLNDEEKEIRRSSLIVPSSDCSIELEVQRLAKELLEKENLLEEKEREFIDKIDSLEDDLKEKFQIINKLDSELADCKKELEMLRPEKPDFANATEKENHNTSILVLPSSEPKEIEIHRLTEEKEALQRELEVFQEIISSLELESTTREMELDHAKQELNLARCKIKDLTTLHSSPSKKLNQTKTLVESVHEDISKVRLKELEDSESYDANLDKKSVFLTDVGDVTQLNKESEDKTDRVDKLTKNEIECDSSKLSNDIFDDDSNTKLRENIIVSLTEVAISEDQKLDSFLAENCVKSSEDLEKMLNQIGLLLKRKQEEIEILKLEKREKKEEIEEDYDVINNYEREKLLDEIKQKDKICEELNYELENLKELFGKLENENISNRETLEKLNRLVQCFNLTGIEGIETALKEALSPSNDLKVDPINIESKSVKCSKTSCLHSSEHLNPNVDIAVEHTREVCESSNINVNELVTVDHEIPKTSESLLSSLEKFEDSRIEDIEEPDILPKANKSCLELNISECDKLEKELFSENLQEKSLSSTENNLETVEKSKRGIKSLEILDDIDNNYSLKYKILEEEVNSKQKEIDSILEEMEKCKRNILSLEEVNEKLKSELNYNKDTIVSLLKELDHFKNLNILVSEEKSKLLLEIEGNVKVCEEKDCEIKRLSDIEKELEIIIEVKVKDYIILKEKVEKIEAILRLHNIEDVDCIEKALSEKASMHVQLSELDQDCNTLKEKVVSLVKNEERMAILSVELDEIKMAFDEKVREEVNMITEMKKNIDIITEKDNEIKINKETIDSLKSDNEEMNKKNNSLRKELNAYDELLMSHSLQGTTDLKLKLAEIELFKVSNREKDEMNRSLKEKLCKYDEILTLYKLENTENLKEELNRINTLIVSNEEKEKDIKFMNEKVNEIESLLKYHNLQGINDLDVELRKYKDVLQELKEKNDECKSLKCEVKDYFAVKEEKELLSVEVELLRKEKEFYFVKEKELNNEIMKKIALQEEYKIQIEKLENLVKDLQTEKESNPKKDRLEKLDIILNTYNVIDIENLEKTLRNVKDLSEELSVKNQECKELKHDMDILFADQATLVETLQERQIALEEHTNALKERDEAIKTLETDLDDLKRVHEECAEKAMKDTLEIENYINIIEKYEFEMTEKEEKSQKIVKEYEIMTNDISDLNSKLKICQETEAFFKDENRRLKLELLESVKKIKALEKDLKELNLEYSNFKGEHQQMDISDFNSKIKQYQESEALFRDENSRLKMELLDSAGKHEALEKDLKDLRVEYNNLKDKHQPPNGNEQMVELNIKLNTLQSENHDLNSEVKNLREQLNEEKNKNKSLDEELDNLDKYYKDCIENYIWTVKDLKGKNKTLSESLKSYKKMDTTNSENVSVDTVVDSKNISNSEEKEIHNLKSENRKLTSLVSKLQEENKSLKSSKKMHTTNYENVSMDTVVDSKNISNNEEIHNLKSESRKLANLVSKLQEENKSLKSSKKMHTTNYENVSMDTIVDSKNISNSEEFYNIQSENRKLANLVSSLREEIELLKKREARKNQEVQTEKDSIDGEQICMYTMSLTQYFNFTISDEASLREQIFNLKKDNNVLKIQLQAIQAPIKNEAQRWKDELKFEQEKNKKLMSELRRVRNENCDSSIVINNPSNTEVKGSSHGGEQACGFGSGVVLDIQVMRLKNANYHLEKEKEKMQNEITSLKENVEWYKAKGSEWKTKCYKEEQKVQKLTQKLKTGDEVKNICSVDKTAAEHKAINAQEIDLQVSGPKYSSTSSKKIYSTPEELAIKASKEEYLIEPCVLQEAPQNTPLLSVEKLRHTKKDEGATASGKENQTRKVRESRKSDECKVQ
ncbi:hypothetical protein Anas_04593 [Armadillidium nasatum]|uniref:Uncharacterized protein n=1 Tax=Armadillidium nasatum TaxID=96803 RepID=A0A5N5SSA4_9CRUS|nr:hypothetical protein Anas_04593 [Armadillidium nasatum]